MNIAKEPFAKAQISADEVLTFEVIFDNANEGHLIWLPEDELVAFSDEEFALVLQYREIRERYYKLCEAKKAEQDAKGM